jgi:hypothetical protein
LTYLREVLHYLFKRSLFHIVFILRPRGEDGFKLFLERINLLALNLEEAHDVHAVPLLLPLLLPHLCLQLLLPGAVELRGQFEVLQHGRAGVLEVGVVGVRPCALLLNELLKRLHDLGLVLGGVRQELLFIQEAQIPEVGKQLLSGSEPSLVPLRVEPVECQYLMDVAAGQELEFDVLVVGAADDSFLVQLHKLGGEEEPEEGPDASVGLVEPASNELLLVGCDVEVDLLLAEDRVGSHVVVLYEVSLLDLQQLLDVVEGASGLQDEQEVDVAMHLLLGQGNVGLQFEADGGDDGSNFSGDFGVFGWREWLSVFECVSSHFAIISFIISL